MADEHLVITPGGYRPRSQVHLIERGAVLQFVDERVQKVSQSGVLLAELGVIPKKTQVRAPVAGRIMRRMDLNLPALQRPALGDGWITDTAWTNGTGQAISSFSSAWIVPPGPGTSSGQLIYLFNGAINSTMILQPVLQWGTSDAGGGPYWSVASWYVDGPNGTAFHTASHRVNPGDVLVGVMTLTGQTAKGFTYDCEFQGIPDTKLTVRDVEELNMCFETLEAYQVTRCSDYPASSRVRFSEIAIACGSVTPTINWIPQDTVTDCGQHAVVVDDSAAAGAVDLWFKAEPAASFDIEVDVNGLESDGCGHSFGRLGTTVKLTAQVIGFNGPYPYETLSYQWGAPQGATATGNLNAQAQSVTLKLDSPGTARISVTATAITLDGPFSQSQLVQIAVISPAEIGVWTIACKLRTSLRFIPQPIPIGDPERLQQIAANPISASQLTQMERILSSIANDARRLQDQLRSLKNR